MIRKIVCDAASMAQHGWRGDAHFLTARFPAVAHPFSVLTRISLLCVRWSAYSAARIAEWRRRARSRRDLMALNERDLWDMHLTRCDALYEASKPFWRE
jgi:uncharacterized protein YjiS (DUF1127 family)